MLLVTALLCACFVSLLVAQVNVPFSHTHAPHLSPCFLAANTLRAAELIKGACEVVLSQLQRSGSVAVLRGVVCHSQEASQTDEGSTPCTLIALAVILREHAMGNLLCKANCEASSGS